MRQKSKCRWCGQKDEMINHIVSECRKLAQNEWKTIYDWVGETINWVLCRKLKFDHTTKWYMRKPVSVPENETHTILWNFEIQTDHPARRSDQEIIKKRTCCIVDFAVQSGRRVTIKENEKWHKYLPETEKAVEHEGHSATSNFQLFQVFFLFFFLLGTLEAFQQWLADSNWNWNGPHRHRKRPGRVGNQGMSRNYTDHSHNYDRQEYFEEFWKPEVTRCYSDSSEIPPANANVKNSPKLIIIILLLESFSIQPMVFHWSLSDSKSPQVSRTLLSILAYLNNVVVWTVSTRPVISKSSSPCTNPLVTQLVDCSLRK